MSPDLDTGDNEDNFRELYGDRRPKEEIEQELQADPNE